jgi:hypothetical protein
MSVLTKTAPNVIEQVIAKGDLAKLSPEERVAYYVRTCESLGLNPLTKPFEYITLNGKLTLYARKDATEQLRKIHGVSLSIIGRELVDDVYLVTARATMADGRTDESIGAVAIGGLKGEARAETKAKRRVTLSACGLGILDESETDSIPNAQPVAIEQAHPAALPPAPVEADPIEAELADLITDAQMHELGALLDQLAYHGIEDEKLLKGICNLSHQAIASLEIDDLAELTTAAAAKILSSYNLKLDGLVAKADAKGGAQ